VLSWWLPTCKRCSVLDHAWIGVAHDGRALPLADDLDMSTAATRSVTDVSQLLADLLDLRQEVVTEAAELVTQWQPVLQRRAFQPSALNLARYIVLRRRDLRALQSALMPLGLSSLGRCEGRVLENLDAVIASLVSITGATELSHATHPATSSYFRGDRLLRKHAEAVFGPAPAHRQVRIMVTLPSEAADSPTLVRELVRRGADVVRINCAHDSPDQWSSMAANARRASREARRGCRVLMDLEGPRARTGRVAGRSEEVRVRVGDKVRLIAGHPERAPDPPQVQCSLPQAVVQLRAGHEVTIDEGRIRLVAEEVFAESALLRVTRLESKGRIRSNKGLNFPTTDLLVDPLTRKDLADLDVVAHEADIVGYSFVQRPADVLRLQEELRARTSRLAAISAKIETAHAVQRLPEIVVQGAGRQPLAVMIARGDLAVEIGFARLAEMQEELLWLCEAAHVPVIWATQVLDTFVRKGVRSRAEMTDAAMAERAECVMLNKGPFVFEAISMLDDVLTRMEAHQIKKTSRLRALKAW
jgi:pyruvate kinase